MDDNIQDMVARARAAFEIVEFWPQERVDMMCMAVSWELQKLETRQALARLAVDESGIGVYEDKVNKIADKARGTLWDAMGQKTCGLIREDPAKGVRTYAKPIGVIANVVPCTNPESTVVALGLSILKTRNAMIVSPHPRTQGSSCLTVDHIRRALARIDAPQDLAQCIRRTSHAKTRELMSACDFAVATGGAALVKVVYEAGTPAHTVGAGNVVSIVDATADLPAAAAKITASKCANNAASCSSENAVALEACIFDEMMAHFAANGGYLCDTAERERLRGLLWPDGEALNRDIVAKPAACLAARAGIETPEGTRMLMVMGEAIGPRDRFSGEKLSPVLTVWTWTDFSEMVARMKQMHKFSGEGHSASIHTAMDERRVELALKANVGRVNCNMPHGAANSGSWSGGNPFTDTLGCGTWAGNMTSENINYRHFLNTTTLTMPIPEYRPSDEELYGEYLARYGRQ